MPKGKTGRPTKFTPEARRRVLDATGVGCTRAIAAQAAGIGESTLYSWIERGEADSEAGRGTSFREFVEALRAREGAATVEALGVIQAAGENGDWRAAAWFLERRYPDHWGRRWAREPGREPDDGKKTLADLVAELTDEDISNET